MIPKLFLSTAVLVLTCAHLEAQATPVPTPPGASGVPTELVALFSGPVGGAGRIRFYDPLTRVEVSAPDELSQLTLLDLDHVGRTMLYEWLPDRPRRFDDVPTGRLQLPGGQGMLYRYRRLTPTGQTLFGFLHFDSNGRPHRLYERRGTGPSFAVDPFLHRIGVAPEGRTFLVATTPAAGGDLLEVVIEGGAILSRTLNLPPLDFSDAGLWLSYEWGFGVAEQGIVRFERARGSQGAFVQVLGGGPAFYSGEANVSNSRAWAICTAGSGPQSLQPIAFTRTGLALVVHDVPTTLRGAGFLPETLGGPLMAISDTGEIAGWTAIVPDPNAPGFFTRELITNRIQPGLASSPVQATGDSYFIDTFDEVGQVFAADAVRVSFALGEPDPESGVEGIDQYDVRLDTTQTPHFRNLTQTSGATAPPFTLVPSITPQNAHLLPGGGLLIFDDAEERIISWLPGQIGFNLILGDAKDIDFLEPWQGTFLASVRRETQPRPHELHLLPASLVGPSLLVDPGAPDRARLRPVALQGDWLAYGVAVNDIPTTIERIHVPTGVIESAPTTNGPYLPTIIPRFGGGAVYGTGTFSGPNIFISWPETGPSAPLPTTKLTGLLLPVR